MRPDDLEGFVKLTEHAPLPITSCEVFTRRQQFDEWIERRAVDYIQVILPPASGVSNEGPRSRVLAPLPAVSWPWVPAWGSLEPSRRDAENAQNTGKTGEKMGEIRPKECEPRELTKDQLAG